MKKLLLLGTGWSQLDLAVEAKKLGIGIHALGAKESGPVLDYADKFELIDVTDTDSIINYARDNAIDFIFSAGLEMSLPSITKASEVLGLRHFFSSKSMDRMKDKYTWRNYLGRINGNLEFASGSSLDDFKGWSIFPAVIKPVDGSGQRGVYKVDSWSDIVEVFEKSIKHSKKKNLIIEEFADGREVSVNSFMNDGKLDFYIISDRISYKEYPGGIIKKHVIPSQIVTSEQEMEIKHLVEEVNKKMGFKNGHVYFQLKVSDKAVKLIEFTPRYDGCHMWRLIKEATGVNLLKQSLRWLSGEEVHIDEAHVNDGIYVTEFISDKTGITVDRNKYEIPNIHLYRQWYYEQGEKVKSVTGYLEKVGFTINKYPLGTKIEE